MAVAPDSSSSATFVDQATWSVAHTISVSSNGFLMIDIAWFDVEGLGPSVASVKYNGVDCSFLSASASGTRHNELWYLVAPASGAHSIIVTFTDIATGVVGGESYTGVDPAVPLGTPVAAAATSNAPSVIVIGTSIDNMVHDHLSIAHGAVVSSRTAGPGQTKLHDVAVTFDATNKFSGSSSNETSAVGPVTMSWSLAGVEIWRLQAVEILAFVPPPPPAPTASRKPFGEFFKEELFSRIGTRR